MFKYSKVYLLYAWLLIIYSCNDHAHTQKIKKETAAYSLPVPAGWRTEKFTFPPAFASQLSYTGNEEVRFAPGWESTTNEQHWSYSFLWWLDGEVKLDTSILQEHIKIYYSGLIGSYIKEKNIPKDKIIPVIAAIKKIATATGDTETYEGSVMMVDYLDVTFNTISLNCLIHKKNCASHSAIIFEISPRPYEHTIWKELDAITERFECK